jgi:hypothetical protein
MKEVFGEDKKEISLILEENKTDFNSNITVMPNPSNGEFSLIFTLNKINYVAPKLLILNWN